MNYNPLDSEAIHLLHAADENKVFLVLVPGLWPHGYKDGWLFFGGGGGGESQVANITFNQRIAGSMI